MAGENVPGIPGACATCNFAYLVRGPLPVYSTIRSSLQQRKYQSLASLSSVQEVHWSQHWLRDCSHRGSVMWKVFSAMMSLCNTVTGPQHIHKFSLAQLPEFSIFQYRIYMILKKKFSKSTCPTGSFTSPGLSVTGICWALCSVPIFQLQVTCVFLLWIFWRHVTKDVVVSCLHVVNMIQNTVRHSVILLSLHVLWHFRQHHIDGLVPERRNSSALAMELCLSCTNPLIWVSVSQIAGNSTVCSTVSSG